MLSEQLQQGLRKAIELDLQQTVDNGSHGSHVLEHDSEEYEFRWRNGEAHVRIQDSETLSESVYTYKLSVSLVSVAAD